MSDGSVIIDVSLNDKTVKSDVSKIESLLKAIGITAGDKMDQQFNKNADKITKTAEKMHQSVKEKLDNPVSQTVEVKDKAKSEIEKIKKETDSIPEKKTTTYKVNDEATRQLGAIRRSIENTSKSYDHMKGLFAGTLIGAGVMGGISMMKNGLIDMIHTGVEYNATQDQMSATWNTLTNSADKGNKMVKSINDMSTAFGQNVDVVNELDQQFYHVFDNQPRTEKLTKAVLTLGDTLGMSSADLERLGLNFTHMLSSGRMQLGDFNMITDQLPMYGEKLLEYERKVQHNSNLTMAHLRDEMSAGKISAHDAEAVMEQLGDKYHKATENMMGTTQGLWRSIQSNWGRLTGEFVKPIFNLKKSGFKDLEDWLASKAADRYFNHLGQVTADFIGKITDLVEFLKDHKTAVIDFGKAFGGMVAAIIALKTVASIMSAFDTVMGGLKRLRTQFSLTAASAGDLAAAESAAAGAGEAIGGVGISTKGAKVIGGAAKAGETVAKDVRGSSKLLSSLGTFAKLAGSTIAVLDVLSSFSSLFGMTKKTAGSHVGAAAGSLGGTWGGAAGGAAIGTAIAPGVGTAIGGGIGAAAGSFAGEKFGKAFGSFAQKHASAIGKPLIKTSVNWGNSVGKNTKSALDKYVKFSDTAHRNLEKLVVTGQKVSKQNVGTLVKPYRQMSSQIISNFEKTKNGSSKAMSALRKTNKKEYDRIMKETSDSTNKKEKAIRGIEGKIEKIYNNAAKKHRSLTTSEQKQVNKLQNKMNKYAVQSMTHSQKQQEIILGKLKDHAGKLSAQQAASIVRNSKKQRDQTIKNAESQYKKVVDHANSQYNGTKKWADQQYYVNHSITKKQYEDVVKNARNQRDDTISAAKKQKDKTVDHATDMHNKVVDQAKKQAHGHKDQVDWETGKVLTGWQKFEDKLAHVLNAITGFFNKMFEHMGSHLHIPAWKPPGYAAGTSGTTDDEFALTGEQGYELAHSPGLGTYIVGSAGPEMRFLPRGTSILSHDKSANLLNMMGINGYANGVGDFFSGLWHKIQSGASDALKIMESPTKMISWVKDKVGLSSFESSIGDNIQKNLAVSGINKFFDGIKDKFKDLFVANPSGSGSKQWIPVIRKAAAMSGVNLTSSGLSAILSRIQKESGGNATVMQRVVDINSRAGHPARGLLQYIPSTFAHWARPGHKNILSGFDQLLAMFNDSNWLHDISAPGGWGPTGHKRYALGTPNTQSLKIPTGSINTAMPKINVPIFAVAGGNSSGGNQAPIDVDVIIQPAPVNINWNGKTVYTELKSIKQQETKINNMAHGKLVNNS